MQYGYEMYEFESEEYNIVVKKTYDALSELVERNLDAVLSKFNPPERTRIKKIYEKGGKDILVSYIINSVMDYFLLELKREIRDTLVDAWVYPEEFEPLFHIFVDSHSDIMDECLYSCLIEDKTIEEGKDMFVQRMKEVLQEDINKSFTTHGILFFPANYNVEVYDRVKLWKSDRHMEPYFLSSQELQKTEFMSVLSHPDFVILENGMCCVVYSKPKAISEIGAFRSTYTDIDLLIDAFLELKNITEELAESTKKVMGIETSSVPKEFIRRNREMILRAQRLLFSIVDIEYPENYSQKRIVISKILDSFGLNSDIAVLLARKV